MQTATLAIGAPFSVIMFLMMYCMIRSFRQDLAAYQPQTEAAPQTT